VATSFALLLLYPKLALWSGQFTEAFFAPFFVKTCRAIKLFCIKHTLKWSTLLRRSFCVFGGVVLGSGICIRYQIYRYTAPIIKILIFLQIKTCNFSTFQICRAFNHVLKMPICICSPTNNFSSCCPKFTYLPSYEYACTYIGTCRLWWRGMTAVGFNFVWSLPQSTTVCHSLPQSTTVCHSLPQSATVCHSLPQSTTVWHSLPNPTIVYHSTIVGPKHQCFSCRYGSLQNIGSQRFILVPGVAVPGIENFLFSSR
jgi:hypothetical protein